MTDTAKRDETTLANELRTQLLALLAGGQAHADFEKVIADMPEALRGEKPGGVPYSAWQLLEHLRITQRDIFDFSTNRKGAGYKELEWPAQYWPEESSPPTATAWEESLLAIRSDQQAFAALLQAKDADLATPFAWGDGQNLLREALLSADHAAYHLGEMVLLRRLLGAWHV